MTDPFTNRPIELRKYTTVILCEGKDECFVVSELCKDWQDRPGIGVVDRGHGTEKEMAALAQQAPLCRIQAIGFVFDAEKSRAKILSTLKTWYETAGLEMPKRAGTLKVSLLGGNYRVRTGYSITPHGKPSGWLESLFIPQIRKSDVWPCIDGLVACYTDNCPSDQNIDKVIVRTFIAHRNAYNTGLGVALRDKILTCEDHSFDALRRFLVRLEAA